MHLKNLIIKREDTIIRSIQFKKGLNLILDAPTRSDTDSGNSVGKSTVLKLIDFCLGSDGQDIWMDEEFKKLNDELVEFLTTPLPISIQLEIQRSNGRLVIFNRSFVAPGTSGIVANIDGVPFERITAYCSEVRNVLFGSPAKKPSLRQLIPKFIRSSPQKMDRTLYFSSSFSSSTDYESIHLFLFGFFDVDVLEERPKLIREKKRITRDLETLRRIKGEGEIEQLLLHIRSEIEEKETFLALAGETVDFSQKVRNVGAIREKASRVSQELSYVEAELNYQERTIKAFEKNKKEIDLGLIKQLYEEAKAYIPSLQKDFADLSKFVDSLKLRKLEYLKSELPKTKDLVSMYRESLEELEASERVILNEIKKENNTSHLLTVKNELRDNYLQLGGLEESLNNYRNLNIKQNTNEEALAATQKRLESGKKNLQECIQSFNKFFTKLSKKLYEEAYILHFDEDKNGSFKFSIAHVGSNVGTGKKATQTAAFDLAYIDFLNEKNFGFPKFVLHDGLETIHDNQLIILLEEVAKSSGQLVIATLRGKLPNLKEKFVIEHTIVELSQQDKLFRF